MDNQQLNILIKTVADTTGAVATQEALKQTQQAAGQAQQQLTGAQSFANQTLQRLMSGQQQTAENFQKAFQTVQQSLGVRPTLRAEDFGIAAQAASTARREITATGEAVKDAHESFRLTANESLRFGGALVGLSVGLSGVTAAGHALHAVLSTAIQDEVDFQRAARGVTATFGQAQSAQLQSAAQGFAANLSVRGNAQDFLESANSLSRFTQSGALSVQQMQQVITAAGELARIHGTDLAPAVNAFAGALQGDAGALSRYGIQLTDTSGRIRGLGATYDELVQISGKARADQLVFSQAMLATQGQIDKTKGTTNDLADSLDRLRKNSDEAARSLGTALSPALAGVAGGMADLFAFRGQGILDAKQEDQLRIIAAILGRTLPIPRAVGATAQFAMAQGTTAGEREVDAMIRQDQLTRSQQAAAVAASGLTDAQKGLSSATQQTTEATKAQLTQYEQYRLSVTRTIEVLGDLGRQQAQQATLQQAVQGPGFATAASEATRQLSAQAAAAQDIFAVRAQSVARQRIAAFRDDLVQAIRQMEQVDPSGGVGAALRQELLTVDRLTSAERQLTDAQRTQTEIQQTNVELAGKEAAIRLSMLPAMQDMQRLQNQIAQDQVRAQQAATPATRAAQDLQTAMQEQRLIAQNVFATAEERQQAALRFRALALQQPGAELAALRAQRPVTAADRAAEDAARAARLQQLQLEQNLFPITFAEQQLAELRAIAAAVAAAKQQQVDIIIQGAIDISGNAISQISDEQAKDIVDTATAQLEARIHAARLQAERAAPAALTGAGGSRGSLVR